MTLDQFVSQYNGQYVDVDLSYGAQCWDIVELYAEQVLGVPKNPWAITLNPDMNAKSAWLNYGQNPQLLKYFDKIVAGQEQKGDITVYDGHGTFTEGHIAICLNGIQVFEQNADPDHSPAHVANRNRTYLLGALRLKGGNMADQQIPTSTQIGEEFQALAGRQPTVDEVNLFMGLGWFDGQKQYLWPTVAETQQKVRNLEHDRDTNLYPYINSVTAALGLPVGASSADSVKAIEALKKGSIQSVVINGINYVPKA